MLCPNVIQIQLQCMIGSRYTSYLFEAFTILLQQSVHTHLVRSCINLGEQFLWTSNENIESCFVQIVFFYHHQCRSHFLVNLIGRVEDIRKVIGGDKHVSLFSIAIETTDNLTQHFFQLVCFQRRYTKKLLTVA